MAKDVVNSLTSRRKAAIASAFVLSIAVPTFAQSNAPTLQSAAPNAGERPDVGAARKANGSRAQEIVEASRAASPEFHARGLLLVAESNLISDKNEKLNLIHEAFDAANSAVAPVKRVSGIDVIQMGTDRSDIGWSNYAAMLNLDRLSLQMKAIEDMERLNPATARNLLQEFRIFDMPPVGCTEALVYDPSAWYTTLSTLARNKAANLKNGKDTTEELLYPAVSRLQTHKQVPLVMSMLLHSDLSTPQLESLAQTFIAQIEGLQGDERGFEAELQAPTLNGDLDALYQGLEQRDSGSGVSLVRGFRAYLVENAKAGGCSAPVRKTDNEKRRILPRSIDAFNHRFGDVLTKFGSNPIRIEEIESNTPETAPAIHPYFESPEGKQLLEDARKLRFADETTRRSLDDLRSAAWRAQATEYLVKVDSWEVDPSSSVDFFAQKLSLYLYLVDLAPDEALLWTATERALTLIENSSVEIENPAIWAWAMWSLQRDATFQVDSKTSVKRPVHDFTERLIDSKSRSVRLIGLLDAAHLNPFSTGPSMNTDSSAQK